MKKHAGDRNYGRQLKLVTQRFKPVRALRHALKILLIGTRALSILPLIAPVMNFRTHSLMAASLTPARESSPQT